MAAAAVATVKNPSSALPLLIRYCWQCVCDNRSKLTHVNCLSCDISFFACMCICFATDRCQWTREQASLRCAEMFTYGLWNAEAMYSSMYQVMILRSSEYTNNFWVNVVLVLPLLNVILNHLFVQRVCVLLLRVVPLHKWHVLLSGADGVRTRSVCHWALSNCYMCSCSPCAPSKSWRVVDARWRKEFLVWLPKQPGQRAEGKKWRTWHMVED